MVYHLLIVYSLEGDEIFAKRGAKEIPRFGCFNNSRTSTSAYILPNLWLWTQICQESNTYWAVLVLIIWHLALNVFQKPMSIYFSIWLKEMVTASNSCLHTSSVIRSSSLAVPLLISAPSISKRTHPSLQLLFRTLGLAWQMKNLMYNKYPSVLNMTDHSRIPSRSLSKLKTKMIDYSQRKSQHSAPARRKRARILA